MHPHGLVTLSESVNTTLSTLGAKTALDIEVALTALEHTFLLKRVRYWLHLENMVPSEGPILVGMAAGNTAVNEITSGMAITNTVGPNDVTQTLSQDEAWKIYRNTLEMLTYDGEGVGDLRTSGRWHRFPGRGIPALRPSGFRSFVFNADVAALADTNTALIKGLIEYQGVWLRG